MKLEIIRYILGKNPNLKIYFESHYFFKLSDQTEKSVNSYNKGGWGKVSDKIIEIGIREGIVFYDEERGFLKNRGFGL